jgi:hypothetical protein
MSAGLLSSISDLSVRLRPHSAAYRPFVGRAEDRLRVEVTCSQRRGGMTDICVLGACAASPSHGSNPQAVTWRKNAIAFWPYYRLPKLPD